MWHDLQLQAATISDNSLHAVVDDSYHDIPISHPAAVVAATTAVAESIRAGNAPLPPCPDASPPPEPPAPETDHEPAGARRL